MLDKQSASPPQRPISTFKLMTGLFLSLTLILQYSSPPGTLAQTPKAGSEIAALVARNPDAPPLTTLRTAIKSGDVKMTLEGDGVTTSSIRLTLTNTTNKPLKIVSAQNECFHPSEGGSQTMMTIRDLVAVLAPGATSVIVIPSVCASTKSVAPPPPSSKGVKYSVGDYGNLPQWQQLAAIDAAAEDLDKRGFFDDIPLAKDTRKEQIVQMAVWRMLGEHSSNPKDKVTSASMVDDLLKAVADQIKKDPNKYGDAYKLGPDGNVIVTNKKQKEAIDQRMDNIFASVDLTVARSTDTNLKGIATLPTNSDWDTFCNVGERAFGRGDYTEAEELLKASVEEAEKFGEADERFSRSLNSLGRCYLELSWTERAEPFLSRALNIREKLFGVTSPKVAETDNNMGQLRQLQNSFDKATPHFSRALSIYEKSGAASSEDVAQTLNHLGRNYNLLKDGSKSEPLLKRALAIALLNSENSQPKFGGKSVVPSKVATIDSPEVAEVETNLGNMYNQQGKYPEAEKFYNKALDIDYKQLGKEHLYVATILDGLADVTAKQDRRGDAEKWKLQAEAIREKALGKENMQVGALPFSYDSFTRINRFASGSKSILANVATMKAAASLLPGASSDKAKANRPIKDKWAVVIGVSKFKDPSLNLQYASKDAKDFAKFLIDEQNFQPDHVLLLTDEKATRANIVNAVGDKWLPHVALSDDLVVLYISSHGSPSEIDLKGANFLIAHDTDKNNLYATGIAMDQLTKMIKDRCTADRVVVFLDACHSGAAEASGKGLFRISNFDAEGIAQGSGQLVVCSSLPNETSWESTRYQNGVFTHCLIDALRKGAPNTKLKEAFTDLQYKVQEEVVRDRGVPQRPLLKMKWDGDDLVIGAKGTHLRPGLSDDPFGAPAASTPKTAGTAPAGSKPVAGQAVPSTAQPKSAGGKALPVGGQGASPGGGKVVAPTGGKSLSAGGK